MPRPYPEVPCEACGKIRLLKRSWKPPKPLCFGCKQRSRRRPMADRFWEKVDKNGPLFDLHPELGQHWLWTSARDDGNYGRFGVNGRECGMMLAHRVAWELVVGPIPQGLWVLHKCDLPPCVNPAHLFLGTDADNVIDKTSKGRTPHGISHWLSKLTDDDVRAIRAAYEAGGISQRELGIRYGVTQKTISIIVLREGWKHVV